ncbi:13397_t:CDS:2 [Funneliformis geosporum]|nr:13397_t:CDS:2 [Funneliformis geosporum]
MLRTRNPPQVVSDMPVECHNHPKYKHIIDKPEQFEQVSIDGGCFLRQLSLKNSINNRIKTTSNDYYRYDIKLNVSQNNEKFHVVDFSTAPPMLK